ncbi:NADPH-dependent FMN reductase [Guptibacillus hwajinpoensis]|uniref:FMN-dependent NADH-azoreductase n=1 Tax=Guptibacillus hwajinpoensis TaxID=208199 RepID=A0A0J6CVN8_9BACL|nr:NADPH-dependent FMN reductase [Alkalihalobacillus macyae]KMM36129.1 FMN-dependent NADH-azoreductase [Alkalihalobacillus macyae]
MKVLVMNGSPREKSMTRNLTNTITDQLDEKGIEVLTFDAGFHDLPLFKGRKEDLNHPEVQRLVNHATKADAFVICSPEYHNGMSGALKNALDFLGGSHFKHKPTVLASVGGGGKGGINALNNMRTVMRGLYALVLPDQFCADPTCFDDKGYMIDDKAKERLTVVVEEFVSLTKTLEHHIEIK